MSKSRSHLEYLALYDKDTDVRIAAIRKLSPETSRSDLEYLALYDSDPRVRIAAIQQLDGDN